MGCCGSSETQSSAPAETLKPIAKEGPRVEIDPEEWKTVKLGREINLPSLHKCPMFKFKYNAEQSRVAGKEKGFETGESDKWYCNGSAEYGFKDGCKGGQKDFDYHENMEGWSCQECEFDLCEACIRWAMHCAKDNIPLGLAFPDEPEKFGQGEPGDQE